MNLSDPRWTNWVPGEHIPAHWDSMANDPDFLRKQEREDGPFPYPSPPPATLEP